MNFLADHYQFVVFLLLFGTAWQGVTKANRKVVSLLVECLSRLERAATVAGEHQARIDKQQKQLQELKELCSFLRDTRVRPQDYQQYLRTTYESEEVRYEDEMAPEYNRRYHEGPILAASDAHFADYVAQHCGDPRLVVDLGCGPASLWENWKRSLPTACKLIGIDLSPGMIQQGQAMYPDDDFRLGSALEIPLQTGSVDVVIASSMLHHIPDTMLPHAFAEMRRVLAPDGKLIGREPVGTGRLGDTPGWFSGALMNFRHLVYRLTRTREYAEPIIGDYHHAYDPLVFVEALEKSFRPRDLCFKHPLSSYVLRCQDDLVATLVGDLDESISHRGGHEFYYAADKRLEEMSAATDVARKVIRDNRLPSKEKQEFLVLLQAAAELLEERLG